MDIDGRVGQHNAQTDLLMKAPLSMGLPSTGRALLGSGIAW